MPKLAGVFDKFKELDAISFVDIARWLDFKVEPHAVENYVANRIIYPQTLPSSSREMKLDLAILREALTRDEKVVFDQVKSTIVLTDEFMVHFTLKDLATALADGLNLQEKTLVYWKTESGVRNLGTIINLRGSVNDNLNLTLNTGGDKPTTQNIVIKNGSFEFIGCNSKSAAITLDNSRTIDVIGGDLGIVVDIREVPKV